ncbi:acyl-CoA N-acyltransferase [Zopfia rhizophila CBS 207.26]|uniref:Acyl-CoA N-acyltransferase n=1 Tax=Zopfia rhizophila CBS 207.26 TaxID=1314779 RepID=A0A6A6EFZ9_9PEZI|nr:acyl-CoA N-acyltransferase [Zopfia rhizophila CBS 207.26]
MFIREMRRGDITAAGSITFQTFASDELFAWLYPRMHIYPDDARRWQLIRLRSRLVGVGSRGFVAVTEEGDLDWHGAPEVVGYAFYVREGNDEAAQKWQVDSIFNSQWLTAKSELERNLLSWEQWYEEKVLDRASDPKRVKEYIQTTLLDIHSKVGPMWHLGMLAVSPKYQRRGIGGKLLKHGQKLAAHDNVPVLLESSVVGRRLYEKSGFKVVNQSKIAEGLDGVTMLWEPENMKGEFIEDLGGGKAKLKQKSSVQGSCEKESKE